MSLWSKLLRVLKITGEVAEDVAPPVIAVINPEAGAIAAVVVQEIKTETTKTTTVTTKGN
jgi:hypothetical protein